MSEESLDQFLAENDLSFLELADDLELPSIDESYFRDPNEFTAATQEEQGRLTRNRRWFAPNAAHRSSHDDPGAAAGFLFSRSGALRLPQSYNYADASTRK